MYLSYIHHSSRVMSVALSLGVEWVPNVPRPVSYLGNAVINDHLNAGVGTGGSDGDGTTQGTRTGHWDTSNLRGTYALPTPGPVSGEVQSLRHSWSAINQATAGRD